MPNFSESHQCHSSGNQYSLLELLHADRWSGRRDANNGYIFTTSVRGALNRKESRRFQTLIGHRFSRFKKIFEINIGCALLGISAGINYNFQISKEEIYYFALCSLVP